MKKLFTLLALVVFSGFVCLGAQNYKRISNEIYATSGGVGFLMDVLIPPKQNGIAVIQIVNGGWTSVGSSAQKAGNYLPLLEKGQTVFFVGTGSRPLYKAEDMVQQVQSAIAFIRKHAAKYGIRPDAIGLTGGSSGGILALVSSVNAPDSCRVEATAVFYPGTDLLNWSKPGESFYDDPAAYTRRSQAFKYPKGSDSSLMHAELKKMSAIYHVGQHTPPTLLIHGTADTVIPVVQSKIFAEKLKAHNIPCKLIEKPGKGHGWAHREKDYEEVAIWFDEHLSHKKQ